VHDDDLRYRRVVLPESGLLRVGCDPTGKVTLAPISMTVVDFAFMAAPALLVA
jgi:hypothetical protein